jgi:hypothetical protein
VLREHSTNDVFVDLDAEGMRDLLGDPVWSKNSNRLKWHEFHGEIAERT